MRNNLEGRARESKKEELDVMVRPEVSIAHLYDDINNINNRGEVNELKRSIEGIETRKARGAAIWSRVKWKQVNEKCLAELFKSVKQKNAKVIMSKLKDQQGHIFTKREDLDRIWHNFYKELYRHKNISKDSLREVFEDFPVILTKAMNIALTKEITQQEFYSVVDSMATRKTPKCDGIPIHLFHLDDCKGLEDGAFHKGVTKGAAN